MEKTHFKMQIIRNDTQVITEVHREVLLSVNWGWTGIFFQVIVDVLCHEIRVERTERELVGCGKLMGALGRELQGGELEGGEFVGGELMGVQDVG